VPEEDGFDWTVSWAAGAIVSTPADLVRWMDALMGGEVVDKAHLDLMMTPTPESIEELQSLPKYGPLKWTGDGLGLLQYQIDEVGTAYGHEGLINGFSANVAHVPAKGLTVAVASNFVPFDTFEALGDLIVRSSAADAGPD
jgi:D-alanyl-D-alanine carboxypeptidase